MDWDEHASTWDEEPAVRAYADAAFVTLTEVADRTGRGLDGVRVLDFGCGTGLLTELLAPKCREVVSLDPASKMIEVLRAKVGARGWEHVRTVSDTLDDALAADHPALASPFDVIVCSSVCAFLPDYPATAKQLASLLSPGGLFVQFDWERNESDSDPFGLTRAEIKAALSDAGLSDVVARTAFERTIDETTMKPLLGYGRRNWASRGRSG
jgi:2-polyprenyl-3-methyl-5-hydroxy-6-metoxy-1,4-benzoquinol methylase